MLPPMSITMELGQASWIRSFLYKLDSRLLSLHPLRAAYYHLTYPVPPTKSVIHDIMSKMNLALEEKDIPYAVLISDMLV